MIFKEHPVPLGKITKVHGVRGGMVVYTDNQWKEPDVWPEWCFVNIDGGPVPFRLSGELCFMKDSNHFVIFIDGIDSPEESALLVDRAISFPENALEPAGSHAVFFPDLSAYRFLISGKEGYGTFIEFLEIPSNELLHLDWMGKPVLVPAREEFFAEINEREKTITLDLPEGLLDLN